MLTIPPRIIRHDLLGISFFLQFHGLNFPNIVNWLPQVRRTVCKCAMSSVLYTISSGVCLMDTRRSFVISKMVSSFNVTGYSMKMWTTKIKKVSKWRDSISKITVLFKYYEFKLLARFLQNLLEYFPQQGNTVFIENKLHVSAVLKIDAWWSKINRQLLNHHCFCQFFRWKTFGIKNLHFPTLMRKICTKDEQ